MFIELNKEKYQDFYAHRKDGKESETLIEHSNLTKVYLNKILKSKNLNIIIDKLILKIDIKYFKLIKKLFFNAIYLHDLGKTNPAFQANKMDNPLFEKTTLSSNHSMLGAEIFVELFKEEINNIEDDEEFYKIVFIMYNFAYQIAKHHGKLSNIEDFFSNDVDFDKSYSIENYFEFYILNKLLFSLLVSSDYYATTEYMANLKIDDFGIFSEIKKDILQHKFTNFLNALKEPKGINILRDEIFKETEYNLLQNLDKNIYYLEAPTGSGKTITSINLALQILNKNKNINKLFYIFPFNTLVEQTKGVFDKIFEGDLDVETINSITPINLKNQEESETAYTNSYVNRLFFHSSTIITTHVSLFNILFGVTKEDNFPLWQLANSVIILDEIQSYNNNLWWYMVEFFDKYAELLNIKIIIMSATLPKLDFFLEKKNNFIDLIPKEKRDIFFNNDYFKKRVEVDFSLLKEDKIELDRLEEFFNEIKENYQKILFEFIKKQTAREFYELIKDWNENVYELSGDDNKAYRNFVINESIKDKSIIIIATQVIEAGVDIDMDLGFKDISTLDSEEQFMGRINRSCKRSGKVYFFNMDNASNIYRGDNRLGFDLTNSKYQLILRDKNYEDYYKEVLEVIRQNGLRYDSGVNTNIDNFSILLKKLDYKEISKTMTLINSQNMTLFFPFSIDLDIYKDVKEFKDKRVKNYITDGKLDGKKVWEAFKDLNEIESFSQKKYEHSYINSLMQFFTFNLIKYKETQKPSHFSYEFRGFFYIENYNDFIDNGKFNRKAFEKYTDGYFL